MFINNSILYPVHITYTSFYDPGHVCFYHFLFPAFFHGVWCFFFLNRGRNHYNGITNCITMKPQWWNLGLSVSRICSDLNEYWTIFLPGKVMGVWWDMMEVDRPWAFQQKWTILNDHPSSWQFLICRVRKGSWVRTISFEARIWVVFVLPSDEMWKLDNTSGGS